MSGVKEAGRHTFVGRSEAFEGVDGKITPNIVEKLRRAGKRIAELPNAKPQIFSENSQKFVSQSHFNNRERYMWILLGLECNANSMGF